MRFGIYTEIQTARGKNHAEAIWDVMAQIEHADRAGFDCYSLVDHHFSPEFSLSPNPLAMFTAAAQRTSKIRFRVALLTLPLENPLRLAGQVAEADILTNGRLECGLGRGHAWLYEPCNVPLEESRPRYDDSIEILLRAWTHERVSFSGQCYEIKNVEVVPKPLQKPHPPIFTGGTSDATYRLAGERGWGIFVPPLLPFKVLKRPLTIYKEACAQHSYKPNIVYIRPVYLGNDDSQIRREAETALHNFLEFAAAPNESLHSEEKKAELLAKGFGFYASGALESVAKLTFEEIIDQEIAFIGTPQKVINQIKNLTEMEEIAELAILSNFGGIEHWKAMKTQEIFSKSIIPAFAKRPRRYG